MGLIRTVWCGHDANVQVYEEDAEGNATGSPIVSYCYWQDFSISGALEIIRRAGTGRRKRKITTREREYQGSVSMFYFRKSEELNMAGFFDRTKRLQFVVSLDKPEYSGVHPYENDTHRLTTCVASNFNLESEENDIVGMSVQFEAEGFE